jgi:hypothetical protein
VRWRGCSFPTCRRTLERRRDAIGPSLSSTDRDGQQLLCINMPVNHPDDGRDESTPQPSNEPEPTEADHQEQRKRQEEGNHRPDDVPGFGEGA